MKYITRNVWILSMISLFTDAASEMLYPVMPIYLKTIGFSVILIGILEGIAEATAGLGKGYFGKRSDQSGKRIPFVKTGYALSAVSKPLLAVFTYPLWVFFARTLDRIGKGIRNGARDALLSDEATPATKGKIFGFHRSMDTLGAVIGPSFALIFLHFMPGSYTPLFYIAFIPGLFAVFATMLLKDKHQHQKKEGPRESFFAFLKYWKQSPVMYRRVVTGLLAFALFNSSDMFLLLKARQTGMNDTSVIGMYIFYNLVYAFFSFPLGSLADKIGLKRMFLAGLLMFAVTYMGMGFISARYGLMVLFFIYGLYAAATEGISKAWISNLTDKRDMATAIGSYAGFQSICALIASIVAGGIWYRFGAGVTFLTTGIATLAVILYFSFFIKTAPN